MKSEILSWIAKNWKKNRDTDYPQTWYYMPPRWNHKLSEKKGKMCHHRIGYPIRIILEIFCGVLGGHELSKTEWGYGGGDMADRHCRWCDKLIRVPKESIYFQFKESDPRSLMKGVRKSL